MFVATYLRHGLRLLVPLAIASTIYLYLYPVFGGCAFPTASRNPTEAFELTKRLHWPYAKENELKDVSTQLAPFRLLTFGDPQLEGDTSIPVVYIGFLPHIKSIFRHVTFQTEQWTFRDRIRAVVHDVVDFWLEDIPFIFVSIHKVFDLFGNDFYLAHIYRTLHWWTKPTHVTVLGDLVGSQWIEDDEFNRRGNRFWNRTFRGGERLPDEVAAYPSSEFDVAGYLDGSAEEEVWTRRILNVAGNHDIGYAGDLTEERMERFERVFGKANYELRFELPINDPEINATIVDDETNPTSTRERPEIRVVVLNDMNLDTPVKSPALQDATYKFINDAITTAHGVDYQGHFTLLLTHIPLYKPEGVCVDAPFFDFHTAEEGGGIKEQYLLSHDASKGVLEGIFGVSTDTGAAANGLGRRGIVLNGHDHAGCDTFHFINHTNGSDWTDRHWEVKKWADAQDLGLSERPGHPGRREITVRSMMGDFGGNAGLLSLWFDQDKWEWQFEFVNCSLGTQHFWWLTHFMHLGIIICSMLSFAVSRLDARGIDVDAALFRGIEHIKSWLDVVLDLRVRVQVYRKSGREQQKDKGPDKQRSVTKT